MKVEIITPYTKDRESMMDNLCAMVQAQDYPCTWAISDLNMSIGAKLNNMITSSRADIYIRMDSDDVYAPDWVSKSVAFLTASKGNCTGLSKAYFKSETEWYLYQAQENAQPYVCGATMCFYRSLWQQNKFRDISSGEDSHFQTNAIVRPHDYIDGFTAILHGKNTASHLNLKCKEFTKLSR